MLEGAFALIDCLGFKGVWRRSDPALVINKLSQIEKIVHDRVTEQTALSYLSYGPIRVNIRLLSDTVAISLQYVEQAEGHPDKKQEEYLVPLLCMAVIKVLDLFIEGEPAFVLRGCISYGPHMSEGNFIVGPAVDEAAEHMDIAEGAFTWLLPSAAIKYRNFLSRANNLFDAIPPRIIAAITALNEHKRGENRLLHAIEEYGQEVVGESIVETMRSFAFSTLVVDPYEMPIKGGDRLKCPVLNPLTTAKTKENRSSIISVYSATMSGNNLSIWLKHQHTMDFLETAEKSCSVNDHFFTKPPTVVQKPVKAPNSKKREKKS